MKTPESGLRFEAGTSRGSFTKLSKLRDVIKLNSVAFSPQANYTDRATAAYRRSYANFCG
jgi:hypothetical protein